MSATTSPEQTAQQVTLADLPAFKLWEGPVPKTITPERMIWLASGNTFTTLSRCGREMLDADGNVAKGTTGKATNKVLPRELLDGNPAKLLDPQTRESLELTRDYAIAFGPAKTRDMVIENTKAALKLLAQREKAAERKANAAAKKAAKAEKPADAHAPAEEVTAAAE